MGNLACSLLALAGCAVPSAAPHSRVWERQLWTAATEPRRGAVVLIHGLNNHPGIMDSWASSFRERGYGTLRLALTGHTEPGKLADVSGYEWVDDVGAALRAAHRHEPHLPKAVVCFSLGCTALIRHLDLHPEAQVSHIVALAPAVRFTPRGNLIRLFLPFRHFGVSLRSRSPEFVRANDRTPLHAYRELFRLAGSIRHLKNPARFAGVRFLAIGSPEDELVSLSGLERWARKNRLTDLQIELLDPTADLGGALFQHAVGTPALLPEKTRARLLERMVGYLSER